VLPAAAAAAMIVAIVQAFSTLNAAVSNLDYNFREVGCNNCDNWVRCRAQLGPNAKAMMA
jgi:hypothetical protein